MSNTIKIEFECPAFESELEINIVIRKDGNEAVVDSTVSSPDPNKTIMTKNKNKISDTPDKMKTTKKKKEPTEVKVGDTVDNLNLNTQITTTNFGGNLMNLEF
jgi:hypothetical protein